MVPAAMGLIMVLTALFSLLGVLLKEKARPTWIIKYSELYTGRISLDVDKI